MQKVDYQNLFVMGEDIPMCPKCGGRTHIILDLSHTLNEAQVHLCLDEKCQFEFVLVYDSEISTI